MTGDKIRTSNCVDKLMVKWLDNGNLVVEMITNRALSSSRTSHDPVKISARGREYREENLTQSICNPGAGASLDEPR